MSVITATPKSVRPHVMVAELETSDGYRYWSEPMSKLALDLWLHTEFKDSEVSLSDYDCSSTCWCVEEWLPEAA